MGRALRGLRISSGRTLNSVARQMKISGPYLSDLERGRRNWNHKLIAQFKETVTE
jgi:transcriptional regulator with XRE-family HTH domain